MPSPEQRSLHVTKYLISFPGEAMVFPHGDFEAVVEASHAVIAEAKAAFVYVFGGGINVDVPPVIGKPGWGGDVHFARVPTFLRDVARLVLWH